MCRKGCPFKPLPSVHTPQALRLYPDCSVIHRKERKTQCCRPCPGLRQALLRSRTEEVEQVINHPPRQRQRTHF